MSCINDTIVDECPNLPNLGVTKYTDNAGKQQTRFGVQRDERSSADSVQFKKGVTQYTFVKENYTDKQKTPKFASHTDYIIWKRMNAQLHFHK